VARETAALQIVDLADALPRPAYPFGGHRVRGELSVHVGSPAAFPLWLVGVDLVAGATVEWPEAHGDEAVYVLAGAVTVDDRTCPEGGAVIVESGARPRLRAPAPARLLHFGAAPGGAHARASGTVHVVGPRGTYALVDEGRDSHYYADSTCGTCEATLLYTSRRDRYDSALHSHSADELIHLLWGEIRLGRHVARPGATLAIRRDAPYRFHSGDAGFGFLNYRSGPSVMRVGRGEQLVVEGGEVNGFEPVMDLR
jgi:hypothetical protein